MQGVAGLRSQSLAGSLLLPGRGFSRGPMPLLGLLQPKPLRLSAAPPTINGAGTTSTLNSQPVTVSAEISRRGEAFRTTWRQIAGLPGVVVPYLATGVYFQHSGLPNDTVSSFVWRCTFENQFGRGGFIDVAFTLTRYTPIPPLLAIGTPNTQQNVPVDPVSRQATVNFSVSVYSGVEPYSYNWVGGSSPFTAANSMSVHLPVGATQGIFIAPSCAITDGAGQSINCPAGPYFFYEE